MSEMENLSDFDPGNPLTWPEMDEPGSDPASAG